MKASSIESMQQHSLNWSRYPDSPSPLTASRPLRIQIKPNRDLSKKKQQVYSAISVYDPESQKYQIRRTVAQSEPVGAGLTPPLVVFEARMQSLEREAQKASVHSSFSKPSPLRPHPIIRNSGLDRKKRKPSDLMKFMRQKRQKLEEQFYQTLTAQVQEEAPRLEEFYYTSTSFDDQQTQDSMPRFHEKMPILAKMINKSMPHKYTLMRQMLEEKFTSSKAEKSRAGLPTQRPKSRGLSSTAGGFFNLAKQKSRIARRGISSEGTQNCLIIRKLNTGLSNRQSQSRKSSLAGRKQKLSIQGASQGYKSSQILGLTSPHTATIPQPARDLLFSAPGGDISRTEILSRSPTKCYNIEKNQLEAMNEYGRMSEKEVRASAEIQDAEIERPATQGRPGSSNHSFYKTGGSVQLEQGGKGVKGSAWVKEGKRSAGTPVGGQRGKWGGLSPKSLNNDIAQELNQKIEKQ